MSPIDERLQSLNMDGVICEIVNDDGTMARRPDALLKEAPALDGDGSGFPTLPTRIARQPSRAR
jgi:hypothetical protein